MQRGTMAMITLSLLALCPAGQAKPDERPVGRAIFMQKSDGTFQPIFPVRIKVSQESGKIVERAGSLECEVRARVKDIVVGGQPTQVIQTVLRCDNGATYVVTGVIYQGDK